MGFLGDEEEKDNLTFRRADDFVYGVPRAEPFRLS